MAARWLLGLTIVGCLSLLAVGQGDWIEFLEGSLYERIRVTPSAGTMAEMLSSETKMSLRIVAQETEIEPELRLSEIQSDSLQLTVTQYIHFFAFMSVLGFDLASPQSHFWWSRGEVNAFGATIGASFLLVHNPSNPTPGDFRMDFTFRGQAVNGMTITLVSTFGDYVLPSQLAQTYSDPTRPIQIQYASWPNTGDTDGVCDLNYAGTRILWQPLPFGCSESLAELSIGSDGFEDLTLTVKKIGIQNLPWLLFDVALTFAPQTKSFEIAPTIDFGSLESCISFRMGWSGVEVGNPPGGETPAVQSISVGTILLQCTLADVTLNYVYSLPSASYLSLRYGGATSAEEEGGCCWGSGMLVEAIVGFGGGSEALFDLQTLLLRAVFPFSQSSLQITTVQFMNPSLQSYWEFGFFIQFSGFPDS